MFLNPEENIESFGLREGDAVADFGAGSGAYALLAAEKVGPTGKVYAVDIQENLLALLKNNAASRRLENIEIIWGNIEIPGGSKLRDALADAVIIANALFQAEDKEGLAREARRVLKPSGHAVVIDWLESYGNLGPAKEHVVSPADAKKIFEKAGFTLKKEFDAGKYHYGIIFRAV